jgi:5'-nucleotidase
LRILVTNDDGIRARGLWTLAASLRQVGEVVVVAPDREQSAISSAITLHHPVRVAEVNHSLTRGITAYSVEGTPADSVILALGMILKGNVDLVLAGINEGINLGNDVFLSGTVGAALQGYFQGLPSVALSVEHADEMHFEVAAKVGALLAAKLSATPFPEGILLNINLPNLPLEDIEGIDVTRLARRSYVDSIEEGHDGKREYYWIVRGDPHWEVEEGTDIWAVENRRISITSLHSDLTDVSGREFSNELSSSLFADLTTPK